MADVPLLLVLLVWFGVNLIGLKKIQPVLDRAFEKSRISLEQAEIAFFESIFSLRNLAQFERAFASANTSGEGSSFSSAALRQSWITGRQVTSSVSLWMLRQMLFPAKYEKDARSPVPMSNSEERDVEGINTRHNSTRGRRPRKKHTSRRLLLWSITDSPRHKEVCIHRNRIIHEF
jgi:hypothetical protein